MSGTDALVVLLIVLSLVGGWTILRWIVGASARRQAGRSSGDPELPSDSASDEDPLARAETRLRPIVEELETEFADGWPSVETLERDERFERAVRLLADEPPDVVFRLAKRERKGTSYAGLAALGERSDAPAQFTDWAFRSLRSTDHIQDVLIFRALVRNASRAVIADALAKVDTGVDREVLARFVGERRAAGEPFDAEILRDKLPVALAEDVELLIDDHEELLGPDFRSIFDAWRAESVDLDFFGKLGKVWSQPYDDPPAVLTGRRAEIVALLEESLSGEPRRSVLLVGEHGVGKTALVRSALERLDENLIVFAASAAELNAGASYVGELEGRVKDLIDRARDKPLVWHLPNLEQALYAGQHSRSPQGLLDGLLPAVAAGELVIVAEAVPAAAERLLAERPQIATAFQILQVRPLDQVEAVSVARQALRDGEAEITASDHALREAFELSQQFLPRIASPGNLLRLVRAAKQEAEETGRREIGYSELIGALAADTGLPLAMLDATVPLRLEDVHRFFESRVLGQAEAVDCLVERIAMVKAGVTDPTRPLGVFLFVGPTGTGKTEIAKALAEFLFGSSDRLVRLDMSEFRTPESHERLLADASTDAQGSPLIAAIRKEPFAVVLLDEFEKAADPIWDLFLQVFDDGRLTDQHGRTVDLRRCVIILTSNIGSSIASRAAVGFDRALEPFRPETVVRALEQSFRPEFLNRIDRVVVFRPFERAQMRALLDKELADALVRRGLRERPWAVELDDSAYEFLINQGFSPSLGARPLKRAVERHLLAPLAETIVEHRAPSGDQFLLVSAPGGERITVTFVDPDAEEAGHEVERELRTISGELDLRSLALAPSADAGAARFLHEELRRIAHTIRDDGVARLKEDGLEAIAVPGFWEDEQRHRVLAEVEYLDRLEAALETALRLGDRLERHAHERKAVAGLSRIVAGRVYVLDRALTGLFAGAPTDVFVRIRPMGDVRVAGDSDFIALLATMYRDWAKKRGMRLEVLADTREACVLAVAGLGCGTILADEAGVHVLEVVEARRSGEREVDRVNAIVDVVPWDQVAPAEAGGRLAQARRALQEAATSARVVRRYCLEPDPLVRDAVRNYRTGRVDLVLAGDFDLF